MKRTLLIIFVISILASLSAAAQTSTGTLTVTATVNGTIALTFTSNTNGPTLTGTGTNTATLPFGTVSAAAPGTTGGITVAAGASSLTVSAPINVTVANYNYKSAAYTLTAKLGTADALDTWAIGSTTITNSSAATIISGGTYNSATAETINLTVPYSVNSGTAGTSLAISNTIGYTATAN